MANIFQNIWKHFVNALYPKRLKCIVCDAEIEDDNKYSICYDCIRNLPFNNQNVCERCGEKIDDLAKFCNSCKNNNDRHFDKARAVFNYTDEIVNLIHNMKFNQKRYIARYLSEYLLDEFERHNWKIDVIVPIPMSEKRRKEREYNQSEELCYAFKQNGYNVDFEHFIKAVDTPHQTNLTKKERMKNLKNSFAVIDKSVFKNKNVLVIDDVYTTGSTMEEASAVIKKAGAKEVYCLTVAHTLPMQYREDSETN